MCLDKLLKDARRLINLLPDLFTHPQNRRPDSGAESLTPARLDVLHTLTFTPFKKTCSCSATVSLTWMGFRTRGPELMHDPSAVKRLVFVPTYRGIVGSHHKTTVSDLHSAFLLHSPIKPTKYIYNTYITYIYALFGKKYQLMR